MISVPGDPLLEKGGFEALSPELSDEIGDVGPVVDVEDGELGNCQLPALVPTAPHPR